MTTNSDLEKKIQICLLGNDIEQAASFAVEAGQLKRGIELLLQADKPLVAAKIAEKHGNLEQALDLYLREKEGIRNATRIALDLGQYERAIDIVLKKGDWFIKSCLDSNSDTLKDMEEKLLALGQNERLIRLYTLIESESPSLNMGTTPDVNRIYRIAKKTGLVQKAIEIALGQDPEIAALITEKEGNIQQAIDICNQAYSKDNLFGTRYLRTAGDIAKRAGNLEQAFEIYKKEAQASGISLHEFVSVAKTLGKEDEAITICEKRDPKSAANFAYRSGKYEQAVTILETRYQKVRGEASRYEFQGAEYVASMYKEELEQLAESASNKLMNNTEYERAINLLLRVGLDEKAAVVAEKAGLTKQAIDLYLQAEKPGIAIKVAERAQDYERAIEISKEQNWISTAQEVATRAETSLIESGEHQRIVSLHIKADQPARAIILAERFGISLDSIIGAYK